MIPREAPKLDPRRTEELRAELAERARAWIRDWNSSDVKGGFGDALLDIAARFASQVAERLDRAGEKLSLGLFDWLGVRGKAATPARVPVVFRLADSASAVLAPKPVQLQADVDGATVVFETEADVKLVPGTLDLLVGIDAAADAYFLPPPGLTSLDPIAPAPTQWLVKSFAGVGETHVQLDPAVGFEPGMLLEIVGKQYRVAAVEDDLATIEPPIDAPGGIDPKAPARKVETFGPFASTARNLQQHVVYLGDQDLFNIEAPAVIELRGTGGKLANATFEYFGKSAEDDESKWRELPLDVSNQPGSDAVVLFKERGAVDPTGVGAIASSRWIRAWQTKVDDADDILFTDAIRVVLNPGSANQDCPASGKVTQPGAQVEGFANTTPLAFTSAFYPLGREPKQFDAFYLGCADAFSKREATVSICFEMSNMAALSFATLREGMFANRVLAGVGGDGALHLLEVNPANGTLTRFRNREPLQPKSSAGSAIGLDQKPDYRLPMWAVNENQTVPTQAEVATGNLFGGLFGGLFGAANLLANPFFIATTAGNTVWLRKEYPWFAGAGQWIELSALPDVGNAKVDGLVYLRDDGNVSTSRLFVSSGGKLFAHSAAQANATDAWNEVELVGAPAPNANGTFALSHIAPIESYDSEDRWHGTVNDGLVALFSNSTDTFVYFIDKDGNCDVIEDVINASPDTRPAAVHIGNFITAFWTRDDAPGRLRAKRFNISASPVTSINRDAPSITADAPNSIAGGSLETPPSKTEATVVATGRRDLDSWIVKWKPFPTADETYLRTKLPAGVGPLGGAPTVLDNFILVPGTQSEVFVAGWNPALRKQFSVNLRSGIVTSAALSPQIAAGDYVAIEGSGVASDRAEVSSLSQVRSSERFYALQTEFGVGAANAQLVLFRRVSSTAFIGAQVAGDKITRVENLTRNDDWLLVEDSNGAVYVLEIDSATTEIEFKTNPNLPAGAVSYWRAERLQARIAPYMQLDPNGNGNWNAQLLDQSSLMFANRTPPMQRGVAFSVVGPDQHPTLVVLGAVWDNAPGNGDNIQCTLDGSIGEWTRQLGERSSNPELLWEYFDGTGWTRLELQADETQDFQRTGSLRFNVPTTLRPTDVSGKTNHWIRARLIRGDYGRERITVRTKPDPNDASATIQEVIRDASDFHPPLVVNMRIRYSVTTEVLPRYVLTQDSGSIRDQSDANRTGGASVEGFVPLSVLMARLAGETGANSDRALMLGLNSTLEGEPINLLLLVQERDHDAFAPLTVEALVNDRFEQLPVRDTTRALGESGLLSLSFAIRPSPRDLFGKTLTWLRLRPSPAPATGEWTPVIRGAYINATWASATETLSLESLGSSDGRPSLTVQVARPPLLHDSLELRVREPLDEEERRNMLLAAPDSVKFAEADLPGDWVLWQQVPDPNDCGPDDRVYALDEISGEIQFGDGLHGMIPPIGRDSIVAFSYQRTEPSVAGAAGVPANLVAERSPLQLVTPVEGVEAAFAADRAAGGSPPENNERVLRFGNARLRHRERALALQDFEDLALQTSADVAQARAFRSKDGLRVVVVMRGADPIPDASQRRALKRTLQQAASPLFAEPATISIEAPRVRRLRLHLKLRVDSLEDAGMLATAVRRALQTFFDSVSGGLAATGWPLGAAPAEEDIAFALDDAPGLAGIADITLKQIDSTGRELAWRAQFRPDELVVLAQDAVRISIESLEAQT